MNEEQLLIQESTRRLLSDLCGADVVDGAESGSFARDLWQSLNETGLTLASVSEAAGGSGGTIADSLIVIREAAKFAAPIPLAENFIALQLLESAGGINGQGGGSKLSAAPLTIAQGKFEISDDGFLKGEAVQVAFARWCDNIVLVANRSGTPVLCTVPVTQFQLQQATNMAGEPRDYISANFSISADQILEGNADPEGSMLLLGALTRAVMMSGALESVLELSVQYSLERQQFGRPIARFQAVQQQLAIMAAEVAAAIRAADAVVDHASSLSEFEVAVAKSRIGDAVGISADIAHQVHGAMGYTREHVLNQRTRRLWCWRDEFGDERYWQQVLGQQIVNAKADDLWATIASRT
ncbi:MAG: acyl-CoA dehydrogenase family protein [Pseudomonadales bacterium]